MAANFRAEPGADPPPAQRPHLFHKTIRTPLPISVIIPAHRRWDELDKTLDTLARCDPPPGEILVHLDQASPGCAERLQRRHPRVRVLTSAECLGPGGARNQLMAAASLPWVANFDDDARPLSPDFFLQVETALRAFPDAAMLSFSNQHDDGTLELPSLVAAHSGYACIFNKAWFGRMGGFVPLPFAYCMEEVDYGIRVHAAGGYLLHCPWVPVEHAMIERPIEPGFQAGALRNICLFLFLRYPPALWPLAALQILRRALWLARRCPSALPSGLAGIPAHLWRHRRYRATVPAEKILSWLRLQRRPVPVSAAVGNLD